MLLFLLHAVFSSAFATSQVCSFNTSLESWLQKLGLPSEVNSCSLKADEDNYLEDLRVNLRGKHILDRRADYEAWLETTAKEGVTGLRFTFYYFKKSAVQTEEEVQKIAKDIEAFAKSTGLEVEKLDTKEQVQGENKNLEWQGFLQFRFKPSKKTPDTRYKIHDLDIGLKFRLNRIEFYTILKTPSNHPAFDFIKTYGSSAVHMLSKGHVPDFSAPSFVGPQSNGKSLSFDSGLGLPSMIKKVHQRLEAI